MRSMSVRDLESTPGQLYCLRSEPEIISTRKGRSEAGSFPFSSFGFNVPPPDAMARSSIVKGIVGQRILLPAGRKFKVRVNNVRMGGVLVALIPGPGEPVELREVAEPELEPDSALLAVELSEVCGTDVHLQQGRLAGVPYPLVPGHVSVGRLEKIRGRLFDVEGRRVNEGDLVTFLDVHRTCNACWYCLLAKAGTRCPQRKVYGITYGLDDGLCGGWASHIYIKPGRRCIRLDAAPETFMAGGCALPTSLHAVERGDIKIGNTVLVLGSGPVGINSIVLALMRGALRVLCIGAPQARLDAALEAGVDAALNIET